MIVLLSLSSSHGGSSWRPAALQPLLARAGEVWVASLTPTTGMAELTVRLLASALVEPTADLLWRRDSKVSQMDLGWLMWGLWAPAELPVWVAGAGRCRVVLTN